MRNFIWFLAGAIALPVIAGAAGFIFLKTRANGFSARAQPSVLETIAAQTARSMALPSGAREKRNPVVNSKEILADAKAHWADHCAICHANDGSGQTEMGNHLYPPAPDMRKERTQRMSDGELFYIIENGIRLTGMPGWGTGTQAGEEDSWRLVRFIRHLPQITREEVEQMEGMNPKSPEEIRQQIEEEKFLGAGADEPHTSTSTHQH